MVPEIWSPIDRFFVSLDCFLPFHAPTDLENQNFEKKKKTPGHIIIFHMCSINENHMMYVTISLSRHEQECLMRLGFER